MSVCNCIITLNEKNKYLFLLFYSATTTPPPPAVALVLLIPFVLRGPQMYGGAWNVYNNDEVVLLLATHGYSRSSGLCVRLLLWRRCVSEELLRPLIFFVVLPHSIYKIIPPRITTIQLHFVGDPMDAVAITKPIIMTTWASWTLNGGAAWWWWGPPCTNAQPPGFITAVNHNYALSPSAGRIEPGWTSLFSF